jgi:spermidine synthase
MKPTKVLDCVGTPDGRELVLFERGGEFIIQVDRYDLMGSRAHGSEEEMARLSLAALGDRPAPRVLVGGLGMGFTLRATLDSLVGRPGARVVVAEMFPAVVEWNRTHLGHLAGRPLDDKRVQVAEGDVGKLLATVREPFDVILLDVDNGPEAMTLESNHELYTPAGVGRLFRALSPGGVLAVWSADDHPRFTDRLRRGGFSDAAARRVSARAAGKGGKHVVFVGRKR